MLLLRRTLLAVLHAVDAVLLEQFQWTPRRRSRIGELDMHDELSSKE
jgi:hypothetical protein